MRHRIPLSTLGLISLVLAGCASTKETVLPQDGPSMKAIYEQHIHAMAARDPLVLRHELGNRPADSEDGEMHGYTRESANEIDTTFMPTAGDWVFPRLPNPTLVMYIFPHLAGKEQVPVPGYATTLPLYERVEYALPGEVPPKPQSP